MESQGGMNIIVLPPTNREAAIDGMRPYLLAVFPNKPVRIKVEIARPDRTLPENAYLHGVCYKLLSDHTGYELEEIAEYLCGSFFGWKERKLPGNRTENVPVRTTTTDENGKRDVLMGAVFWEFIEYIIRVGAKQGVYIPPPDPEWKNKADGAQG